MRLAPLRAFTLLELIVSIAIVGLLAALLLGGVNVVRERGDGAQCTSNLRQLAAANVAYSAEHDGQYAPAQDLANKLRWHGFRDSLKNKFNPGKGALGPYLGAEGRVKLCPAFRHFLTDEASFNEQSSGGYGYNAVYVGGTPGDPFQPERVANIARPARTVMFTDTALPTKKGVQEYPFSEPWQRVDFEGNVSGRMAPSVHFRHGDRANVAWCDGHATSEQATRFGGPNRYGGDGAKDRIGWFGPADGNGWWNPRRTGAEEK